MIRFLAKFFIFVIIAVLASFFFFVNQIETKSPYLPQNKANLIIVLTGGKGRVQAGLELLKVGKASHLLISGAHYESDLETIKLEAKVKNVHELENKRITIDYNSTDTISNAKESAKWIKAHDKEVKAIILVTSNYHMPRSLFEFHRLTPNKEIIAYPVISENVDLSNIKLWDWRQNSTKIILLEYVKYMARVFGISRS